MSEAPNIPQSELEKLDELSSIDPLELTQDQMDFVFNICKGSPDSEIQMQAAALLSEAYKKIGDKDKEFAKRVHVVYLKYLLKPDEEFGHPVCNWLAATHLKGENLAGIPWDSVQEIATAAEAFYNLTEQGLSSEEVNTRVRDLVKYAGAGFAGQGRWEDLFQLLCEVHVADNTMDADFYRLKNTVLLYEQKRVVGLRRLLKNFIFGVLVLVLLVSPALFLMFENKHRSAIGYEDLTFFDALYWSVITSGTVGYGDIVPLTMPGRVLAMLDSLLVIVLLGVIAGLILSYLTPRNV